MRAFLYIATFVTCILTAILDVWIDLKSGYDPFTYSFWIVIPVGALFVGAAATSGAAGVAYLKHYKLGWADAVFMVVMALGCIALIEVLKYLYFQLPDGRYASQITDFWTFSDLSIRTAHMQIGRALNNDMGQMDWFGYVMLGVQVLAFAFGGFCTFALVLALPACQSCPSYLRKVRETTNGAVSVEDADKLLGIFQGSFEDVNNVIAWKSQTEFKDKKDPRAMVTYKLYECPNCKLESAIAMPKVFNGKEWKDVPKATVRRNLAAGTTLWTAFK